MINRDKLDLALCDYRINKYPDEVRKAYCLIKELDCALTMVISVMSKIEMQKVVRVQILNGDEELDIKRHLNVATQNLSMLFKTVYESENVTSATEYLARFIERFMDEWRKRFPEEIEGSQEKLDVTVPSQRSIEALTNMQQGVWLILRDLNRTNAVRENSIKNRKRPHPLDEGRPVAAAEWELIDRALEAGATIPQLAVLLVATNLDHRPSGRHSPTKTRKKRISSETERLRKIMQRRRKNPASATQPGQNPS